MGEKTTSRYILTDEQAIRIGVADILVTISKDEATPEQKSAVRALIEEAVRTLKTEVPPGVAA